MPLVKEHFTSSEHDTIVGEVMQKVVNLGNILGLALDSMKDWCPEEI